MDRDIYSNTDREQNGPPVIATVDARQAVASGRVRYVLIISVTLVVIAFAGIYVFGGI